MHTSADHNHAENNGAGYAQDAAPLAGKPFRFGTALSPAAIDTAEPHKETDQIARNRDAHGNRLPWAYAGSPVLVDDVDAYQTDMKRIIAEVDTHDPIAGAELGHFYNQRLLPTLRRLVAVHEDAEKGTAQARAQAEAHNRFLDEQDAEINRDDRNTLAHTEAALPDAHAQAGVAVARTGGEYDPASLTPESALRLRTESLESLAGELRLPWTPTDKHATLVPALAWLCSVMVGTLIGVSIALASKWVPSGNWFARPVPLAVCVGAGLAAAVFGKWFVKLSARAVGERFWLGLPATNWGPLAALSFVVTGGVVTMDACVEREGLMAGVRLQETLARAAGGGHAAAGSEALFFLMAMILTFGYAGTAWWEGYLSGRNAPCLNRLRHAQETRFALAEDARRGDGAVQNALEAVAAVNRLRHWQDALAARIAERKAALDAQRVPVPDGVSPDGLRRIQDAVDQMNHAQAEFDGLLAEAKLRYGARRATSRSAGGFWNWLLLSVEGAVARGRRPRPGRTRGDDTLR